MTPGSPEFCDEMFLCFSLIFLFFSLGLVHGDDPERCCGEGGGKGGSCLGTHVRIKDFKI